MRNEITTGLLTRILSVTEDTIAPFIEPLKKYTREYRINTSERLAAFLSQVAHESGCFRYTEEIASGAAYEGRLDLGNTQPGDGCRYKGRGLIQLTGRYNYSQLAAATGIDFISNPELLSQPEYAVMSACWYWQSRGLNSLADTGQFLKITKRINGGYNGLADREYFYRQCKEAFYL
ncbi:MAG: glycoside hydrolase family 19 protein [Bacteroidales bacterium]|nr:glycoside hydrolase family 19 protein [Bacteroidales bacterium]